VKVARRLLPARILPALLLLSLLGACSPGGSSHPAPTVPGTSAPTGQTVTVEAGERPFQLYVPASYVAGTPVPLVVLLHGYRSSAAEQESYFGLKAQADLRGFLYALPDGTRDKQGNRFWNATDACCDFDQSTVDDSAYLHSLIANVRGGYSVDPRRVYVIGHSNGGFMTYRTACEHADEITAVVSLGGAMWNDPAKCAPARPVSVLEIHGSADETIRYTGGSVGGGSFPGAEQTVADWRHLDGCADRPDTPGPALDLDSGLPGAETTEQVYRSGCRGGTTVHLWTIKDGRHVPALTANFAPAVVDFLLAQVAPAA
jgi:polyhydroxybutyrate depolymerase